MNKVFSPADWAFDLPALVKLSGRGLRGADKLAFVKRAGHCFVDDIEQLQHELRPGEVPAHIIALGATEAWGANSNGDGFKAEHCKTAHDTFVKLARCYRDHRNKDSEQSYGRVIKSAFNPEMQRIELLAAYNGTQKAAEANGGKVADREVAKLENGDNIKVSMACRIRADRCSCCGNEARHRGEYCGPEKCAAGGCRDNLGRLVKLAGRLHHLHVDNPEPRFFDISDISDVQADRTAFGAVVDWAKAASLSADVPRSGALRAEALGVTGPWSDALAGMAKLAAGLAVVRDYPTELATGFSPRVRPRFDLDADDPRLVAKLAALADIGAFVGPDEFAFLCRRPRDKVAVDYASLAQADLPALYEASPFQLVEALPTAADREFARTKAAHACTPAACARRVSQAHAIGFADTSLSPTGPATPLGIVYGLYKLAALWRSAGANSAEFPLTVRAARVQDQIV